MEHRIDRKKKGLGNGFDSAIKALTISMAILAILPIASAEKVEVNMSEDVKLNITQSLFNESKDSKISYYVQVMNEGSTLLKYVNITDILPPGVAYLWPNNLDKNEAPLLKCIDHNADKTTKKLIWQIGSIHTGEYKWLNFTVQRLNANVDASQNEVSSEGMTLGYLINGPQLLTAMHYSAPKLVERTANGRTNPQPTAITEIELVENATNDSVSDGMLNDTFNFP